VLLGCPGVADVAVVGIKSFDDSGEVPRAYVVKKEGVELSEADFKSWVEGQLAKYKRLNGGVVFMDSIPKSPGGKILKRVLKEEAKKQELSAKL
jgi:acyl-CoA synthetase (AMP-forming)/AMP-acid ligase II